MQNLLPKNWPPAGRYLSAWPCPRPQALLLLLLMTLLGVLPARAQQATLTGKVTGETQDALPGVTVLVKGTTNGTTTDVEGNFSLPAPAGGTGTLVVSYVGYVTQEVAINNRSTVNIRLAVDAKALQEVVVVGYGTKTKESIIGSVATVSSKDLAWTRRR